MRRPQTILSLTLTSIFILCLCASATTAAGPDSTTGVANNTPTASPSSSTGGSYPRYPGGSGGFGPPPWIGTAIEQYQASLRTASQNAPSTTSQSQISPTAQGVTIVSSATATTAAQASGSSPPKSKSSSSPPVQNWVIIVAVVIANWLLTAIAIYYCLRRRRHKEKETASHAHQPPIAFEADNQSHHQRRYEAPGGDRQPEMHDTQRLELNGSWPPASRSELPV
ncbi:MAG: hypothetical protein Q9208_002712 [Pyrenodesmia sp. 3 TL-2023]